MIMDILQKSKEIEELYKNGKYSAVLETATPLLKELTLENGGPQIHKYCALAMMSANYGDDDSLEIATNAWNLACDLYNDTEALKDFLVEFIDALSLVYIGHIKSLLNRFNFVAFDENIAGTITKVPCEWCKFFLLASVPEDEALENALEEAKNTLFYNRFWAAVYDFAVAKWYREYNAFLENNFCDTDSDRALNLSKKMTYLRCNIGTVLELSTRYDDETDDFEEDADIENCVERCKQFVEIVVESIDLNVQVSGSTFYLFEGNGNDPETIRYDHLAEFDQYVSLISRYDPTYEPPQRPAVSRENDVMQTAQNGGCYIATAVYGSYDCPQVWTLRRYRDTTLAATWYGRAFIKTYYAISPTLVEWFGDTMWFKNLWKVKLDRMVAKLQQQGVADTAYEDKVW